MAWRMAWRRWRTRHDRRGFLGEVSWPLSSLIGRARAMARLRFLTLQLLPCPPALQGKYGSGAVSTVHVHVHVGRGRQGGIYCLFRRSDCDLKFDETSGYVVLA